MAAERELRPKRSLWFELRYTATAFVGGQLFVLPILYLPIGRSALKDGGPVDEVLALGISAVFVAYLLRYPIVRWRWPLLALGVVGYTLGTSALVTTYEVCTGWLNGDSRPYGPHSLGQFGEQVTTGVGLGYFAVLPLLPLNIALACLVVWLMRKVSGTSASSEGAALSPRSSAVE